MNSAFIERLVFKCVHGKTEAAMGGHPTQPLHPTRGRALARRFRGSCIATLRVALLGRLGRAPGERQNVSRIDRRSNETLNRQVFVVILPCHSGNRYSKTMLSPIASPLSWPSRQGSSSTDAVHGGPTHVRHGRVASRIARIRLSLSRNTRSSFTRMNHV
jgi:hypothetical protein